MPESKKNGGCLKFLAVSSGAIIGLCILYVIIILPINKAFKGDSSPQPTDTPQSTDIPETYGQAITRLQIDLTDNMIGVVIFFQDPDFDITKPLQRSAISQMATQVSVAYSSLTSLEPPTGYEQEHAIMLETFSDCDNSAKWFDNAMDAAQLNNTSDYAHAVEQAYLFFDSCQADMGF